MLAAGKEKGHNNGIGRKSGRTLGGLHMSAVGGGNGSRGGGCAGYLFLLVSQANQVDLGVSVLHLAVLSDVVEPTWWGTQITFSL